MINLGFGKSLASQHDIVANGSGVEASLNEFKRRQQHRNHDARQRTTVFVLCIAMMMLVVQVFAWSALLEYARKSN
jgi:hypothetical protein